MALNRLAWFVVFLCLSTASFGQTNRYMIFFKDKAGSAYNTSAPGAFLSQRAIDRRLQYGISITEQDIPVNEIYIDALRTGGAIIFFTTRWMNGVLVQCDASLVPSLEAFAFVDRVEFVAPNAKLISGGRRKFNARSKGSNANEKTRTQLQQIGLDEMQDAGYRGETIHIGIFDSGFQGVNITSPFQHIFNEKRIDLSVSKDFVFNSG